MQMLDPKLVFIRGNLEHGSNVLIETNVTFEGDVYLGNNVVIRANTIIRNSKIGSETEIKQYSFINNSNISEGCIVGPYARLRTGSDINSNSQIGTYVEVKNSKIGSNCKINHMAFIGDAIIEDNVIIGAGTITCNHDGKETQQTIIKSGAYIGSNVNLIAPIEIGNNALIGAGSTVTNSAPNNKITIERAQQVSFDKKKRI